MRHLVNLVGLEKKSEPVRESALAFRTALSVTIVVTRPVIRPTTAPSPKVKGVPSPWNPVTGAPNSWTTTSPDGDAGMRAMRPNMIRDIEQAARNMKLNISRDAIERLYEEWLQSPTNKWVK
jgi:hypothetical protein